ncbi:MAG: choice-of-anchor D domain-containing protein [Acidobacteria bacterium]|nr:choice-of-anchor D domain-containing protein [Acidobacteriota bacterium]MCI0626674.1 choice-of-anchor D domain-containing protein [Acidobacteriota bacterium]MCI0722487.1 choice-of-anchor D domain-containing protein [Acidobacteriota bacterium]
MKREETQANGKVGLLQYSLFLCVVALALFYGVRILAQVSPPTITGLSPSSAIAGGGGFTLTVTGTGFTSINTVVQWNGSGRPTSFVSVTQVTASIPATDLQISGNKSVTVSIPGAVSGPRNFPVRPAISGLSPSSALAGGPAFILILNGAGFVGDGGDSVLWNGGALITNYVSSTQLTATVSAPLIANSGTAVVSTLNSFAQLTSAPFSFFIDNPAPALSGLSPNSVLAGSSSFTLTVNGSGFVANSVVRWNGSNRSTSFVSGTQLQTTILASDIASAGTAIVTVVNPLPGGGTSGTASFTISPPRISVTTTTLNFGDVLVGSSSTRILTVTNLESSAFQITASTSAGSPYTVSPSFFTLPVNGSVSLTINFTPPAAAVYDAVTSLTTSLGGETIVNLTGRGVSSLLLYSYNFPGQPSLSVLPGNTISFPSTDLGASSSLQFRIQNSSSSPSTISSIASSNALFVISSQPALPAILPANGSVTFTVTFTPATVGGASGTLSVNSALFTLSGAAVVSPLSYRYTLSGQAPVTVSPGGSIPLPSIVSGGTSSAQFEAQNSGAAAVALSSITSNSSLFPLANLPSLLTVPAGGSLAFTVQFRPVTPATATAALTVGTRSFTLTGTGLASGLTLTGITEVLPPAQQPRVGVTLATAYAVPLNGQISLIFTSTADAPSDDPAVVFASGGRVVNFTVPANATQGEFSGGAPDVGFSTGTVAGNVRLNVVLRNGSSDITPSPDPSRTVAVERRAPVIISVTVGSRTASGFEIIVIGYSTPRSLTQAAFRFSPRTGSNVQGGDVTVNVTSQFTTWYQSSASQPFGSQFRLSIPFTVQGDINAIGSVSVTLANAVGTSAPASANF